MAQVLAEGVELTLIGMGVVLGSLLLLALVVRVLEPIAGAGRHERPGPGAGDDQARQREGGPPDRVSGAGDSPPPAVAAVIAGALAATLGTEPGQLRLAGVRRLEPAGQGPAAWALAGRTEQMRGRQPDRHGRGGGRRT